jgi:hypothetical protein
VIEEVLEGILFDVEAGIRFVITNGTVKGGEAVKQRVEQPRAPLGTQLLRRLVSREST